MNDEKTLLQARLSEYSSDEESASPRTVTSWDVEKQREKCIDVATFLEFCAIVYLVVAGPFSMILSAYAAAPGILKIGIVELFVGLVWAIYVIKFTERWTYGVELIRKTIPSLPLAECGKVILLVCVATICITVIMIIV
jgi:hypothetical protein